MSTNYKTGTPGSGRYTDYVPSDNKSSIYSGINGGAGSVENYKRRLAYFNDRPADNDMGKIYASTDQAAAATALVEKSSPLFQEAVGGKDAVFVNAPDLTKDFSAVAGGPANYHMPQLASPGAHKMNPTDLPANAIPGSEVNRADAGDCKTENTTNPIASSTNLSISPLGKTLTGGKSSIG